MKAYKYTINGKKYEVVVGDIIENIASVSVNGEEYKVEMEPEEAAAKPKPVVAPASQEASKQQTAAPTPAAPTSGQSAIKAPLPGTIIDIKVNAGDEVKAGDTVVILEAMKMANNLEAEKDGKVVGVYVQQGQSVMEGDTLVVIE